MGEDALKQDQEGTLNRKARPSGENEATGSTPATRSAMGRVSWERFGPVVTEFEADTRLGLYFWDPSERPPKAQDERAKPCTR